MNKEKIAQWYRFDRLSERMEAKESRSDARLMAQLDALAPHPRIEPISFVDPSIPVRHACIVERDPQGNYHIKGALFLKRDEGSSLVSADEERIIRVQGRVKRIKIGQIIPPKSRPFLSGLEPYIAERVFKPHEFASLEQYVRLWYGDSDYRLEANFKGYEYHRIKEILKGNSLRRVTFCGDLYTQALCPPEHLARDPITQTLYALH